MAKKSKLKIIPLGGLDEIGKNMTVLEYGNEIVIVDCGMAFPDDDMPGVDLVINVKNGGMRTPRQQYFAGCI